MRALYETHQASLANGYSAWLIDAWKYRPEGRLRYRDGRAYPE